jgi:hypothetical protein
MTDDHQIRALLTRAAELPEDVQPPVGRLLEAGRRLRQRIIACSVFGVVAVTAAALALPHVLRPPRPVAIPIAGGGGAPPHPPTAGQLSRFHWSGLPRSPLGPRSHPILAWTDRGLFELGGTRNGVIQRDGAVFDPTTRRWHAIARIPNTIGLSDALTVWTGRADHQLFVTNGLYPPLVSGAPVRAAGRPI